VKNRPGNQEVIEEPMFGKDRKVGYVIADGGTNLRELAVSLANPEGKILNGKVGVAGYFHPGSGGRRALMLHNR